MYAHIVDPIRRDTARRIDGLLWAPGPTEDCGPETGSDAG